MSMREESTESVLDSMSLATWNHLNEAVFTEPAEDSSSTGIFQESLPTSIPDTVSFSVQDNFLTEAGTEEILLSTMWNQYGKIFPDSEITFNEYCPIDPITKEHSVTGCTNTAAGQIIYYWIEQGALELQLTLNAADAYTSNSYGRTIVIDGTASGARLNGYLSFADVNAALKDFSVDSAEDIAALNFACGVVQESGYSSDATGTVWDTNLFYRAGMVSAYEVYAYGSYATNSLFVYSEIINGQSVMTITDAGFEVLIENILAGQPVATSFPGHALVIDGYNKANDTFHINYGWGEYGTRELFEAMGSLEGTGWYTREEMHEIQFYNFIIDITPTYDDSPIEVSDTRSYGTGTFLRAIERANAMLGENTIVCSDSIGGNDLFLSDSIIVADDLRIEDFNLNFAVTGFSNMAVRNNGVSLSVEDLTGTVIINSRQSTSYGFYNTSDSNFSLSLNGGGIFAGSYSSKGDYKEGASMIQTALEEFRTSGLSAIESYVDSAKGYAVFNNSVNENTLSLDNQAIILGNLYFGSGNDTITVNGGSCISGNISFGAGNDLFEIDNSSSFTGIVYSTGSIGVTITVNSAATGAGIINLRSNIASFTHFIAGDIVLDLNRAGNGEYILFDATEASYATNLKNLNFTVNIQDSSFKLSLASGSASNGGVSLRYEDSRVYLTVENSNQDIIPPTLPDGLTQTVELRDVTCSWNDSTDNVGVAGYSFRYGTDSSLSGNGISVTDNSFSLSDLANGTYYWQVRAYDAAGNYSDWSSVQKFTIDVSLVAPVITVTADTKEPVQTVTLTASTDDGSPIYYNTVSADYEGSWTLYTTTITVTENTTYYFKATNEFGNTGTSLFHVTNIDRVAPTITGITASTLEPTNGNVSVTAKFDDDVRLASKQYRIGAEGKWMDYTGAVTVTQNTVLFFKAVDAAGNETVEQFQITNIDRIPPEKPVASADMTEITNQNVTVFAAFSEDSVVREYSLNGTDWFSYIDGVVMKENGSVYFRGTDAAGNVSEITEYVVSNIDTSAPDSPVVSASITEPTNQNVIVSAVFDPTSVLNEYKVDDGEWMVYSGPIEITENAAVSFRSRGASGNYSETVYIVSNIDRIPPEKPLVSADITDPTNQNVMVTATFDSDASIREYSFDGELWNVYEDGVEMTDNGVVYFRGTDAAGNVSEIVEYIVSNIDRIPPEKPVVSANLTELTNQDVIVTAVFSEDSVVREYSLNGTDWFSYGSDVIVEENGSVYFRGTDAAGNVSEIVEYIVSNIDKLPPERPVVSANITEPTNQNVIVSAVFAEDSILNEYKVNDGEWLVYENPVEMTDNGIVYFRSTDAVGNTTVVLYKVTNIDRIPPEKPLVSADITDLTNQEVVVTASFDADSAIKEYSLDGEIWLSYTEGITFQSNGIIYFRAIDLVGNVSEIAEYLVSNIDKTAPEISIAVDNREAATTKPVFVSATVADDSGVVSCEYSLDGATWFDYTTPIEMLSNGTIWFRAQDSAGNIALDSYAVSNIYAPPATLDGMFVTVKNYNATFSWEKYEAAKGAKVQYQVMVDGVEQRKLISSTKFTLKNASVGEHDFAVRAVVTQKGQADIYTPWSSTITQYVADVSKPKTGKLTVEQTGEDSIRLTWTPGEDNMGVVRYVVTCSDGQTRELGGDVLSTEFTGISGKVTAAIVAYDAAGLAGQTVKKTLTMKDMTAPTQVTGLSSEGVDNKSGGVLVWDAASDNVAVTQYEITVANVKTYKSNTNSVKIGKMAAGTYKYTVVAFDKAKNASIISEEGEFTVADVIDPKISKLSCKVTNQTVVVSWSATDESGAIARSELWLDGSRYADTTGLESFALNDVSLGQHSVELKVWDAAGNDVSKTTKCNVKTWDPLPVLASTAETSLFSTDSESKYGLLASV